MHLSLNNISLTAVAALTILLSGSSTTTALPTNSQDPSFRSFPAPGYSHPHLRTRAEPASKLYANHRLVRLQLEDEYLLTKVENQLQLDYVTYKILGDNVDIRVPAGKSYEGREQAGIKIGKGPNNAVLHGLQHAREWITGPVVEYLIHQLMTGTDAKVAKYSENYTFHIIPIMNPDGYIRTQTGHRMHRKNTQPNPTTQDPSSPDCIGTDLNRNWDIHWSESNDVHATDVCSEVYRGISAFSAPEKANIAKYLRDTLNVVSYLDFHAQAPDVDDPLVIVARLQSLINLT
ncbi:hypothetical protein BGZ70_008539 [Mortierella alpina]|uniref:Peptidase M14 domain-containing protein n=1 Tax=Mortierella alpina TaxID=64518 RepID=A0A9P6JDF7_MORAP|nr:hypothetical protein BGZ70_008539 [Mortierella alpina]